MKKVTEENAEIIVFGIVTETLDEKSADVAGKDPQPAAWFKKYKPANGSEGVAFCSTFGASSDLDDGDIRRLFVNAIIHLCGLEVPAETDVSYVDPFVPSAYSFNKGEGHYKNLNLKPSDYGYGKSPQTGPAGDSLIPPSNQKE